MPELRAHRELLRRILVMEAANDPGPVEDQGPIAAQAAPPSAERSKVVGE
jgi:hypothetical protein